MYVLKLDFAHLMGWPSDWKNRPEYQAKALELKINFQKSLPQTGSVVAERGVTDSVTDVCYTSVTLKPLQIGLVTDVTDVTDIIPF